MLERAILNNNDNGGRTWVFGRGLSSYKTGQKAIEQDIKSALLEFENDCYFALQNGIDWETRLGYHNQQVPTDEDIISTILKRDGVVRVENFKSTVSARKYNAQAEVYTIYSETPILFNFTQGA